MKKENKKDFSMLFFFLEKPSVFKQMFLRPTSNRASIRYGCPIHCFQFVRLQSKVSRIQTYSVRSHDRIVSTLYYVNVSLLKNVFKNQCFINFLNSNVHYTYKQKKTHKKKQKYNYYIVTKTGKRAS